MFDVKKNNAEIKEVWNNTIEFGKKVAESEHVKKSNAAVKQAAEKIAETKAAQYIKNKSEEAGQKVKNQTHEMYYLSISVFKSSHKIHKNVPL